MAPATASARKVTKPEPAETNGKITAAKKEAPQKATTSVEKSGPKTTKTTTKKAAPNTKPATKMPPKKAKAKATRKVASKVPQATTSESHVNRAASDEEDENDNKEISDSAAAPPITNGVAPKKIKRKADGDGVPEPAAKKPRVNKSKPIINAAPTTKLKVFVFGEGSSGELGLGTAKRAIDVKRPRLNPFLLPDEVGVVQIAVGGMHMAALTHDNKILTWGVNDQGALGRDTKWDGGLKDIDAAEDDSDDEKDDNGLNPKEATPTAIDMAHFPEGTIMTQIAAGDSTTFAVTADGSVYGWGTFRNNEGILGFTQKSNVQFTPMLIPELKKITYIALGANHALALDDKGVVYAWGSGQQNQLGRRVVERTRTNGLVPRQLGVNRARFQRVACGSYHSFGIDNRGRVWSWGLNNYGETGVIDGAGDKDAVITAPTIVKSLEKHKIIDIKGGAHHSLAINSKDQCLVWGRIDGNQLGIKIDSMDPEDVIFDERGNPRILKTPTAIPGLKAIYATTASDSSIAITPDGRAYSWGFSANYQTGQGTDDDIEVATLIDNTATRDEKLNWAGAGGQFSVLTSLAS